MDTGNYMYMFIFIVGLLPMPHAGVKLFLNIRSDKRKLMIIRRRLKELWNKGDDRINLITNLCHTHLLITRTKLNKYVVIVI